MIACKLLLITVSKCSLPKCKNNYCVCQEQIVYRTQAAPRWDVCNIFVYHLYSKTKCSGDTITFPLNHLFLCFLLS